MRAYDQTAGASSSRPRLPSLPADLPQTLRPRAWRACETPEGPWRVYTHVTEEGIVQVGQPVATRDALARELSLRVLMPMLLLIPLLAVLVAWALKRGAGAADDNSRA